MANINANPGIKTTFSGGDTVSCLLTTVAKSFLQVESEGFTLDNCLIEVKGVSSTDWDVIEVDIARHAVILGDEGAMIGAVRISGVAAGSYKVTFIPFNQ